MLSLQPTTTGSATAIALIYPELKGKLNGHAVRAPVLNASLTDCVFELKRPTTEAEVNALFAAAAHGPLAGILGFETRPLVSADYCNDTRSSIVDAPEHHGHRRHAAEGLCLVRQRDRLCLPHGRSRQHRDRSGGVMAPAARNYLIVTASYWGFTLVDGALRMLVLLHFFQLGYSPFTLAFLFLLYEIAGIVANLGGGWLATRFGIPRMLAVGQVAADRRACSCCRRSIPAGARPPSVAWVVVGAGHRRRRQGLHQDRVEVGDQGDVGRRRGPAVQLGGLVHRLEERHEGHRLLRRRPAARGRRLPAGAVADGRRCSASSSSPAWCSLPRQLGKAKASKTVRELFAKSRGVNLLAAARIFLFGARDVWFVVGLPVFLYAAGWRFVEVGGFLAAWTIGYGGIQAVAPALVTRSADGLSREVPSARLWARPAGRRPAGARAAAAATRACGAPTSSWSPGLALFGLPFAVNSSLHSYLILAYAGSEKAAEDVGFYYAANAAGRLIGILLSGALYQAGGMTACLSGSAAMLAVCWAITFLLPAGESPRGQAA